MIILFSTILFFLGLIVGSFLNVVIFRIGTRQTVVFGRSFCPYCKNTLKWYDLIPILSFIILLGKCRYCRSKISWQYPIVEFATAVCFVAMALWLYGSMAFFDLAFFIKLILYLIYISFFIIIFVYDLKHYLILDKIIFPAIIVALAGSVVMASLQQDSFDKLASLRFLLNSLLGGIVPLIFFTFLVLISKGKWMGGGDIKLGFFIGLILGWPNILVALGIAFISGAIIGIILILQKKKKMKSELPFGTFLTVAAFVTIFFGDEIVRWYLGMIGM